MRDPELLLSLLREMAATRDGRTMAPRTFGMSEDKETRHHHVEQLVDAGHAEWTSPKKAMARITHAGYDFIDAVEKQERVHTKFLELVAAGIPYLMAAKEAMEFLQLTAKG